MSLADSLKQFKSERADVVSRNLAHARPATTSNTPARSGTPKPADQKCTHDAAFSGPALGASAGAEIMKLVVNAVQHMKEKGSQHPETFDEIVRYSSLPLDLKTPRGLAKFKQALQTHHRLQYLDASSGKDGKESFKYKPLHPVTNGEELRAYLSRLDSAQGIPVKELKDGWQDCIPTLDRLESQGFILLTRNKKDNIPRSVYPDDPSYHLLKPASTTSQPPHITKPDEDFISFWGKVRLPPNDNDIRNELERAGLTPTSAIKEARKLGTGKKERKRVDRKNTKKTNTHMVGILKDYSKLKK
ncbi:hypothetical protein LTR78_004123 [Recurvomyces mirabilis]|uniref:Transcription initiation factor IIE subunit beta n=1 Tax=Recurvomyces mirabilis TaxID=574656 RepID=A0AAE0WQE3_9PEZI|nr:hypothetical protein LTR78_004123 [Recurvomyces mirabilis]KAK5153706.1 hypothetical protein LTS14_007400 [Recurvomyces mirabilis]